MSDLFRQSTPAPGRYSRKLFFYLAFGILFYSGVDSAIDTFNNDTAAPLANAAIQPVRTVRPPATPEDDFHDWSLVKAQPHSPHALDPAADRPQAQPRS